MKILIVDDDDALRRMLVDYLSTQGYTALGVRSVQQGEEALRTDTFDLILADLRLDDGSGLELLKQLKQLAPKTVGILMTGYATIETAVEAMRVLSSCRFQRDGNEAIQPLRMARDEPDCLG